MNYVKKTHLNYVLKGFMNSNVQSFILLYLSMLYIRKSNTYEHYENSLRAFFQFN